MKKLIFAAAYVTLISFAGSDAFAGKSGKEPIQITPADTTQYVEYSGRYKMQGMPFDYIELAAKDGKLYYVAGEYQGDLTPKGADEFSANGQASVSFTRDAGSVVKGMKLNVQGQDFVGTKEMPKMDARAYVGQYRMTGLPFETMDIKAVDGKLLINAMGEEGELRALAAPDQFDAAGRATLKFTRDTGGQVIGVMLDAQGQSFEGVKK